ncbi:mutator type transposase [Tanacetum coccineum]
MSLGDDVEESLNVDNYQVNDMAVDDTMRMREESYDDVASTDRIDYDNYDANYVYEGSGQPFESSKQIKDRVCIQSIETRRKLELIKNDKRRVRAKCVGLLPLYDLNDNRLPLVAYIIVDEAECKDSWCWFLNMLGDEEAEFQAIVDFFPSDEHRYYLRHIHENMKKQWNGLAYKKML